MENYIRKCLSSLVLNDESFDLLEVLIINDGSKDKTSEIAHLYEQQYPNVFHVVDKENGNYGSCINRGLIEASGKYVKILDADDYFNPESLLSYLSFLSTTDVDLVLTDYNIVDEHAKVKKEKRFPIESVTEYIFDDICTIPGIVDLQMHAVTYKLKNLKEFKYHQTEGISYTDQEWIFLPMTTVKKVVYYPAVLYNYLVGREGQTMQTSVLNKSIEQQVLCANNRLVDLKNRNLTLSENMKSYLFHALARVVTYVYRASVLRGIYDVNKLKIFDDKIKELNCDFYMYINEESIGLKISNFKYIKWFRKNGKSAPTLLSSLYLILYKLFHKEL